MKHKAKVKPYKIWNNYIVPGIEIAAYTLAALLLAASVISAAFLFEALAFL